MSRARELAQRIRYWDSTAITRVCHPFPLDEVLAYLDEQVGRETAAEVDGQEVEALREWAEREAACDTHLTRHARRAIVLIAERDRSRTRIAAALAVVDGWEWDQRESLSEAVREALTK